MLVIDGSMGEGGGQILRTSLTLSLATGTPFRVVRIRARRSRPGLLRQHLTAVQAAATIGNAEVEGAELGSSELVFRPRRVQSGTYRFSVGTAGSATLVLQTLLPVLLTADGPSELVLEGGTHNPQAPPFEFIDRVFLPIVSRMGPKLSARLIRRGFYPAGGGAISVAIKPVPVLQPLVLLERGGILEMNAEAVVAGLPLHIAERETRVLARKLGIERQRLRAVEDTLAKGPGNVVFVEVRSAFVTELFAGFGERGVPAEKVASRVAREVKEYLAAEVPVGRHLADQLLLPLALGSGGRFRTLSPSRHTLTNLEVVRRFLDLPLDVVSEDDQRTRIEVGRQISG